MKNINNDAMNAVFTFFKTKYNLIVYFLLTIVGCGSLGVWFPMLLDWFAHDPKNPNILSDATNKGMPNNIITYFLSIFLVSLIDRILYVIDKEDYKHRKTEIFISIVIFIAVAYFVLNSFRFLRMNDLASANKYALIGAAISFIVWWIANYQDTKTDPYSALGGNNFK